MIQVRHVSDELHSELRKRAAARGQTLTAYIQEILEREVSKPTAAEWWEQIRTTPRLKSSLSGAELVREARREAGWD